MASSSSPWAVSVSSEGVDALAPAPPHANKFLLLPLTLPDGARELPVGERVPVGRRSHAALNNLHISREQVCFELKRDIDGRILICMTNVRRQRSLPPPARAAAATQLRVAATLPPPRPPAAAVGRRLKAL